MMHWESAHELNAYRLLDADTTVIRFYEQPVAIRYRLSGDERRHYPDTLVHRGALRELWEIKPADQASHPELLARSRLLEDALPHYGYVYRLVVGEELASEPRLSTVLQLLKHGRQPVTVADRERIRVLVGVSGAISWGTATAGHLGPRGRAILARLVLEGVLHLDANEALTPDTRLNASIASREESHGNLGITQGCEGRHRWATGDAAEKDL